MKARGVVLQRRFFVTGANKINKAIQEDCSSPVEVFAIDPSITATGWAYRDEEDNIKTGVISQSTCGFSRLIKIERFIRKVLEQGSPFCFIEGYSFNSKFGREKAGELGGVIRRTLWYKKRPLLEIPPQTLKSWIKAKKKEQIMLEILSRYGVKISDNNAADAFVLQDIGRCLLELVSDFCKRNISDPEEVRLFFKEEDYKESGRLEKLFKYQANSIFNLVQSSGFKAQFYKKANPLNVEI